jgi:hypothetical protein
MFDYVADVPFRGREAHLSQMKRTLASLKPGLTYLITHPAIDSPELRAMIPDLWEVRVADYEVLMQRQELSAHLRSLGIHLVTWRDLRALMRSHHERPRGDPL